VSSSSAGENAHALMQSQASSPIHSALMHTGVGAAASVTPVLLLFPSPTHASLTEHGEGLGHLTVDHPRTTKPTNGSNDGPRCLATPVQDVSRHNRRVRRPGEAQASGEPGAASRVSGSRWALTDRTAVTTFNSVANAGSGFMRTAITRRAERSLAPGCPDLLLWRKSALFQSSSREVESCPIRI
jgi:hypothetical protein